MDLIKLTESCECFHIIAFDTEQMIGVQFAAQAGGRHLKFCNRDWAVIGISGQVLAFFFPELCLG